MKKFYIQILFKIFGVSAASGLLYHNPYLYLISDDSNYLYVHHLDENKTSRVLLKNAAVTEIIPKAQKQDFEVLAETSSAYYIFGSGSKPNRELGFSVNKETQKIDTLHLSALYASMRSFAAIADEDFNIEGAVHHNNEWYFLNRGNGPGHRNVIFTVQGQNLTDDFNLFYNEIDLPALQGVPSGFSDAVVVKNTLFFLATAENVASTYQDGAIGGTLLGAIDLKKMKILFTEVVSTTQKFEGITFYQKTNDKNLHFLLCEDLDSTSTESTIYELQVELKSKLK